MIQVITEIKVFQFLLQLAFTLFLLRGSDYLQNSLHKNIIWGNHRKPNRIFRQEETIWEEPEKYFQYKLDI